MDERREDVSVLVIEDDPAIRHALRLGLERAGLAVHQAEDGQTGLRLVREVRPDAVLLDLMLPRLNGLALLDEMRRAGDDTPVLVLTAKDELADTVRGLERGADDYLTKPFHMEELVARLRALLRRRRPDLQHALAHGDITLDVVAREVRRSDQVIELTPREFELLRCLLEEPRRAFDRETLLRRAWGYAYAGETNVVDVYVRYLRRKLGDPDPIRTVRGVGYGMRQP
ncbi:MAG: response regulator transcription factor [Chloroflexota bacterium]